LTKDSTDSVYKSSQYNINLFIQPDIDNPHNLGNYSQNTIFIFF